MSQLLNKWNILVKTEFRKNILAFLGGGLFAFYTYHKLSEISELSELTDPNSDQKKWSISALELSTRERRFIHFSSVEYNRQFYMTPQDFLDSLIKQNPKERFRRDLLRGHHLELIKTVTPPVSSNSNRLFRNIGERGIISYTEYLFLLTMLTKPSTGFLIAFELLDLDGNRKLDRKEFLVMEDVFTFYWNEKRAALDEHMAKLQAEYKLLIEDRQSLQRSSEVDTTLLIHFFGPSGKDFITFNVFKNFVENLQHEVLEFEFNAYARGGPTISETDFANLLLYYTYIDAGDYKKVLDKLKTEYANSEGILFKDFKVFCLFLNHLEDFSIAMRKFSLSGSGITKDDFIRAVRICTEMEISPNLVDIVFTMFDTDGDGYLSSAEFINIMKDRLHRGFKKVAVSNKWDAFLTCVVHEMKKLR